MAKKELAKQEMVFERRGEAIADSLQIATNFGKRHTDVVRVIENLTAKNCTVKKMFFASMYVSERGKEYKKFFMNRDGFSLLIMGFTGKAALEWKLKYIDAFNKMEKIIQHKQSEEWQNARQLGKGYRKSFTDAVQMYVSYCAENGSKSAWRYYGNLTSMMNKAVGCDCRESATASQLATLLHIEDFLTRLISAHVASGTEYHDIFADCKARTMLIVQASNPVLMLK